MILIPKIKELWLPLQARVGIGHGRFKLEAVDKYTGKKRVLADWFPNLITTNGANQLGTNNGFLGTCAVGSGNATPALTDTALQTLVTSTTSINSSGQSNSGSAPWFSSYTVQFNFPVGTATGNLSEIGVGLTATSLFSRALILDGGGSPTTITVLSSEALYATYQVNQYAPTSDVTGTVVIAGVTYSYTLRAANVSSTGQWALQNGSCGPFMNGSLSPAIVSAGAISAVTGSITGVTAQSPSTSVANGSYSSGSFTNSGTVTWGLTTGNVGGVTAAQTNWGGNGAVTATRGSYQIGISPAIPKDASHILTLTFSLSWAINVP